MSKLHITAEVPTASLDGGADVIVLVASGELDYDSCPLLRTSIFSHIGAGRRRLVVDLSAVTFIDSMAIGVLVGTVARLRSSGGGALVGVCEVENRRVTRIFEIAGVANVISLYGSREEALRALVAAWMVELPSAAEPAFAGVLDDPAQAHAGHSGRGRAQSRPARAPAAVDRRGWSAVRTGLGHRCDELAW